MGHNCPQKPLCHIITTFFVAKITNWDMSEKSAIIKADQEGKLAVFVSQMYSKSLMERRNEALK